MMDIGQIRINRKNIKVISRYSTKIKKQKQNIRLFVVFMGRNSKGNCDNKFYFMK